MTKKRVAWILTFSIAVSIVTMPISVCATSANEEVDNIQMQYCEQSDEGIASADSRNGEFGNYQYEDEEDTISDSIDAFDSNDKHSDFEIVADRESFDENFKDADTNVEKGNCATENKLEEFINTIPTTPDNERIAREDSLNENHDVLEMYTIIDVQDTEEIDAVVQADSFIGIGTESDPIQISSRDELRSFCQKVSNNAMVSDEISASNAHVILTQNIDMFLPYRYKWIPLGNDEVPFTGVFDGCGYTISNFELYSTEASHWGIFGSVDGGTIQNVGIENMSISVSNGHSYGIGGLVGKICNGRISNCYVKGRIMSDTHYGGMIGEAENSQIENCFVDVEIEGGLAPQSAEYSRPVSKWAGGIIGYMNNSTIRNCYSYMFSNTILSYAGGIVGEGRNSDIESCYAVVDMNNYTYQGGFAGYITGSSISNCFVMGEITGRQSIAAGACAMTSDTQFTNCAIMLSKIAAGNSQGYVTIGSIYPKYQDYDPAATPLIMSGNTVYALTEYDTYSSDIYVPEEPEVTTYDIATTKNFFLNILNNESNSWNANGDGLPTISSIDAAQDDSLPLYLQEAIAATIISVEDINPVLEVPYNTTPELLTQKYLPKAVNVILGDGSKRELPIKWNILTYSGTLTNQPQFLEGTLVLPDTIINPKALTAKIGIRVDPKTTYILSIESKKLEVWQNLLLSPVNKEHESGCTPTAEDLPETVWAGLSDGTRVELPVLWDVNDYDFATPGETTYSGQVLLSENAKIKNLQNLSAELTIIVVPKSYYVYSEELPAISMEVLLGTSVSELNEMLVQEGKQEISVIAYDAETFDSIYLFCDIEFGEDQETCYDMNAPGNYMLMAYLPNNFLDLETENRSQIPVSITVLEPSDIVKAEAHMSVYQSVGFQDFNDMPTQVNALLENGKTIPIDVEWNWGTYDKDSVGGQVVLGALKELPAAAKYPIGQEIRATLLIDVIPMQYYVTGVKNNSFVAQAGLSLEELNAIFKPTITLQLASKAENNTFEIEYDVAVWLKEGTSGFDLKQAKEYTFTDSDIEMVDLPDNIEWSPKVQKAIILTTEKVAVEVVEPLYALACEGMTFEEIELPTQAVVILSCYDLNGEKKRTTIDVDWNTVDGYLPTPEIWDDDGTATVTIAGSLINCEGYVSNVEEMPVMAQITITPAPKLLTISPNLLPASGAIEVKIGSLLEEVYAQLDSHTVELVIEDYLGEISTVNMTFLLREEDNLDYDAETQGTYVLKAYLPLGNTIKNPNAVELQILVKTVKYTIFSVENLRLSNSAGLAFEELNLPEEITVTRNDKNKELVGVTWSNTNYDPDKIGMQIIQGELNTPLPAHLENPNNRQPKIFLTLSAANAKLISLTPAATISDFTDRNADINSEVTEYRFWAEILCEDGTIVTEIISMFEEGNSEMK